MDPTQAAAGIGALIEGIKKAKEIAERLKNAEMQGVLLDAQERALSLEEELLNLRAENARLKGELAVKADLKLEENAYWRAKADTRDGPYCTRCYDDEGKLIRLKPTYQYWHECPKCETRAEIKSLPANNPPPMNIEIERV